MAGVRNEADAKLLSEKQRQIADLQNQLKTLVSLRRNTSFIYYLLIGNLSASGFSNKSIKSSIENAELWFYDVSQWLHRIKVYVMRLEV